MARRQEEGPSYGRIGVVVALAGVAAAGVYAVWDYERKKKEDERLRIVSDSLMKPLGGAGGGGGGGGGFFQPRPAAAAATPIAQDIPVPPPTPALIKQMQHYLNLLSGKTAGHAGFIKETGSVDYATTSAIKAFQRAHKLKDTGKLDGHTRYEITNAAAYAYQESTLPPPVSFLLGWDPATGSWMSRDTAGFVFHIPGHADRNNPPNPADVADMLAKHYGTQTPTGKAFDMGRYSYDCPDCASTQSSWHIG
jgi:peptidoglycan hydrolase-like protein with peptidoglycan-binding domain